MTYDKKNQTNFYVIRMSGRTEKKMGQKCI